MTTKIGLVTGAAGFIGSHICDRLLAEGWEVVGLDDYSAGHRSTIETLKKNPKFRFVEADVTKSEQLEKFSLPNVDCVFHHAGKKMAFSVKQPREDLMTNALGTLNMLIWSKQNNAKRFTMASTIAVYGNPEKFPTAETDDVVPTAPYGVSKFACEEYCRLWYKEYKLPVVIFRYGSIFGPRQGLNVGAVSAFISKVMKDEPITVFGDGTNTRPFTYVADVVEANMLAANSNDPTILGDTFNVASGKSFQLKELITVIAAKLKKEPKIIYENERVGEIRHMGADITKIQTRMNFRPTVTMAEGVGKTVEFYETERLSTVQK